MQQISTRSRIFDTLIVIVGIGTMIWPLPSLIAAAVVMLVYVITSPKKA